MKHLKAEFDKLSFKDVILYSISFIVLIAGLVLLFMSMWIPPEGEIHNSVLATFGIILMFVGAIYNISMKYESATKSFQNTILKMLSQMNTKVEGDIEEIKKDVEKD
ncbi:MAG: hypothetical protein K2M59_01155 [Muribaculaceae bacterium]|nr:hypothetical protein [Muribaculaceae bacterium]